MDTAATVSLDNEKMPAAENTETIGLQEPIDDLINNIDGKHTIEKSKVVDIEKETKDHKETSIESIELKTETSSGKNDDFSIKDSEKQSSAEIKDDAEENVTFTPKLDAAEEVMDVDENPTAETEAVNIDCKDTSLISDKEAEFERQNQSDPFGSTEHARDESEPMETDEINDSTPVSINEINDSELAIDSHQQSSDIGIEVNKTTILEPEEPSEENDIAAETDNNNHEKSDEIQHDGEELNNTDKDTNDDSILDASKDSDFPEPMSEEGVDDLDQGKGVDEEVCLIPDEEREISEAEKEQAILAKEAAEQQEAIDETQSEESSTTAEIDRPQEEGQLETETIPEENEATISQGENVGIDSTAAPKENEIKENLVPDTNEKECVHCKKNIICKFSILLENEIKGICNLNCVEKFRQENNSVKYTLVMKRIPIDSCMDKQQTCINCNELKICKYRIKKEDEDFRYLCEIKCIGEFIGKNSDKYLIRRKRYIIDEAPVSEKEQKCIQCTDAKFCKFVFKEDEENYYICHEDCINLLLKEQPDRFRVKRRSVRVRDLPRHSGGSATFSKDQDHESESAKVVARSEEEAAAAEIDRERSFLRTCGQCYQIIELSDKSIIWATMDFCNEVCLGQYQNTIGSICTNCNASVTPTSLGKYCVRFGFDVKQFCCPPCLDEFKKKLKVCSYCQKDIRNGEGFLAPVGDKKQFRDFCEQACMKKYEEIRSLKKKLISSMCAVCNNNKPVRVEVNLDSRIHKFCSNPCFSAFKFVNNICADACQMCKKYFERKSENAFTIYVDQIPKIFCTKICMNFFIIANRKIVNCNWCKVKKYNFDMISKGNSKALLCSLKCLKSSEDSVKNSTTSVRTKCDNCLIVTTPQYFLPMSDASNRSFCTYQCAMSFQSQFGKPPLNNAGEKTNNRNPIPTGLPKRIRKTNQVNPKLPTLMPLPTTTAVPVISNVTSLSAGTNATRITRGKVRGKPAPTTAPGTIRSMSPPPLVPTAPPPQPPPPRVEYKTQIVTVGPPPIPVANKATMCKPAMTTKGVTCRPHPCTVECQTDDYLQRKIVIPIPVPIYVPTPMHMYSMPVPIPVPIPLPIPIPVFIPTTRNSAAGIMKEIKKIQDKMPTDPFEAELLMMAEMVAGDKKNNESDSGSEDDGEDEYVPEVIGTGNAFGEDMLQMALKMATEYEEPAVDLESAMTASTITPSSHPHLATDESVDDNPMHQHHLMIMEQHRNVQITRGRKRGPAPRNNRTVTPPANKRSRRSDNMAIIPPQPEPPREPIEKPDANMCLKYTFGVNAWKQWVMTKNADLEKSSIRRKPFKSELLQLTADELNYSLCLFVKEVRKPNGSEYAPDTIYYLVLGIQQYLYENGRIDNIFTDPYYEKFTDCLDEVAKKFSVLYNDSQYIVTRVEEEHLWECKQLGAHSPHVLLSTLMFFNTKHFNLTTVDEHMQLSFSHIMKHWKRNPNQPGAAKLPGSRNVLLRFYPPQVTTEGNSRKKKVYEQQENEENPLRCPVKLYEFYLSKCPESVKTRNDVFYLQPERSCVPDSPVWYSTQALGREALSKMLHRVKMVKEINIALLTS